MATHDYVIANQGFPAFRSDLNDALAAIVSNNSSATEPTTMFAHMIWVDTAADPSILKIRNADNDAWITIGTINQTGDTFTLTSAVSATTLNTSGAVVFNDAGADVDFRVEGDTNANLLFVDAGNDRVGIGTSSPSTLLDIQASGTSVASEIELSGTNSNGDASCISRIGSLQGSGLTDSVLQFSTRSSGTLSERARITSGGELLIGTTSLISGGVDGLHLNSSEDTGISFAKSGIVKAYFYLAGGGTGTNWRWQTVAGITVDVVSDTNGVTLANGGTSWGTLSDERKKDIIEPIENAAEKVSTLRAVIGKYKTEEDGIRRSMLIAQDVQAVLPEAVVENSDGDLVLQYTDTIPLLVAAVKELKAELDTVKAELATLKGQ